jgi:hypothetical protein
MIPHVGGMSGIGLPYIRFMTSIQRGGPCIAAVYLHFNLSGFISSSVLLLQFTFTVSYNNVYTQ